MATRQTVPLSTEQLLNANQDDVRGQQTQLAQHASGSARYIDVTLVNESVFADNEIDVEDILGREASEITIESETNDIFVRFESATDAGDGDYSTLITKFIHKNRAYTLDKCKVGKMYLDNSLSGSGATIVRIDMV